MPRLGIWTALGARPPQRATVSQNEVRIMDAVSAIADTCHAAVIFDRVADGLIVQVRRAMNVPEQADPDMEEELAALRADFDAFLPEFRTDLGVISAVAARLPPFLDRQLPRQGLENLLGRDNL